MPTVVYQPRTGKFLLSDSRFGTPFPFFRSLRGRRSKGKGKGVLDTRETRGAREEARAFLSRLKLPFPSPPTPATQATGVRKERGRELGGETTREGKKYQK